MKFIYDKIMKTITLYCLFMLAIPESVAGDFVDAGIVLSENSYVMSEDEIAELKVYIEELEQDRELLEKYKVLDKANLEYIGLLNSQIVIKNMQIDEYKELSSNYELRIDKLEKYQRFRALEDIGFTLLGMGFTFGTFFAVDALEDKLEPPAQTQQLRIAPRIPVIQFKF